jgi:peroxiredoxin
MLDRHPDAAKVLEKQLDGCLAKMAQNKPEDGSEVVLLDVVSDLLGHYKAMHDQEKGKNAIERIREVVKKMPDSQDLDATLTGVMSSFLQPGLGDVLSGKFKDLNGKEIDLANLKGKIVLVDFWASDIAQCVENVPYFVKAYQQLKDKGFDIVSISLDKDPETLKKFLKENKITWSQSCDGKGIENPVIKALGVELLPSTFLLGKDGKVLQIGLQGAELAPMVEELMQK